jgi:hypothetical protein
VVLLFFLFSSVFLLFFLMFLAIACLFVFLAFLAFPAFLGVPAPVIAWLPPEIRRLYWVQAQSGHLFT